MLKPHYLISPSSFGDFGLVWQELEGQPLIIQVYLPGRSSRLEAVLQQDYPQAAVGYQHDMEAVAGGIRSYLDGADINFDLKWLDWERCTGFQARVLKAEHGIPRGRISTYGRIARKLGVPGGSRAVGSALAKNPFPILIPCHRAVRSTGELGGYQGGLKMKKKLLEMEDVVFSSPTRVSLEQPYYER